MPVPPGYVDVNERIVEFRDKYPNGSLQSHILTSPVEGFIVVQAYAYRTPDDERPGTGLAWEPVPGKTNFTRDSELMNAETSAWGRALIAVGAADAKRGIASANEVRNRQHADAPAAEPAAPTSDKDKVVARLRADGVLDRFPDYLETVFGAAKWDALDDEQRRQVVDGLDGIVDQLQRNGAAQ